MTRAGPCVSGKVLLPRVAWLLAWQQQLLLLPGYDAAVRSFLCKVQGGSVWLLLMGCLGDRDKAGGCRQSVCEPWQLQRCPWVLYNVDVL